MSSITQTKEFIPVVRSGIQTYFVRIWRRLVCIPFLINIFLRNVTHWLLPGLIDSLNVMHLSFLIEQNIIRNIDYRRILSHPLRNLPIITMSSTHTHKTAAEIRTSANIKLNDIVKDAGMKPYTVSMSGHDEGLGSRYFYMIKDLNVPFKHDKIPEDAVLLFTDVDYYADMNYWLKHFKPILMYTFSPKYAARRGKDYSYYIKDNFIYYAVAGGAPYKHQVWDYSGDTICMVDDELNLLTYHVTQHEVDADENRRFISILPSAKVKYPYYTHLTYEVGLKRREFTFGKNNVLYNHIDDTLSIASNGSPHSVELKGETYLATSTRLKNKSSPPVVSDVERLLNQDKIANAHVKAPILYSLMEDVEFKQNIIPTNVLPCVFQTLKPLATEDGNNPGKEFSNPLSEQPSVFAARSYNNDVATVEGRINKVKNPNIDPPRRFKRYAQEFVDFLVPDDVAGTGVPWALNEVFKAQNRPAQVARAKMAEATLTTVALNKLTSFIKAEPYVSTNDPRNITTCAPELTSAMSCFTYAYKNNILKKCKWYGPGKTPEETISRIREVSGDGSVVSDVSRLDGSMSTFLHSIHRRGMMKWLHCKYRHEYMHWHRQTFTRKACTSNGVKYDAGTGTRSGSPVTTDTNTEGTCFVDYCSFRENGMIPKEAWDALGIYTGDDGARADHDGIGAVIERTAALLGLTYKCESVIKGDPITYCGRVYVDPSTSNDTFQDPKRTIPKLHLTANKNVSDEQAAANKAAGYIVTDLKTPIIGDWARKVAAITKLKPKNLTHEEQFKVSNAWPQSDRSRIEEVFCQILGITKAELNVRVQMIENVTALDQFPVLFDIRFDNKIDAVLGSEIVTPVQHVKKTTCQEKKKKQTSSSSTESITRGKTRVQSISKSKRDCKSIRRTRLNVKAPVLTARQTLRK